MAEPDVVLVEVHSRIATVTLNRPQARNALSRAVLRALPAAIRECGEREDVDVIILTAADSVFCAGLDLKELGAGALNAEVAPEPTAGAEPGARAPRWRGPIPPVDVPVIGAINGVAVTGGLELALACDFLVASDRARFADTHARVGVMPGWGLTVLLPQAIGVRRAREMSVTGNFVDARTALEWGLVNHVVPHDELLGFCRGLAADIVSNDAVGVARLLQTYRDGAELTGADAWELEGAVSRSWMGGAAVDPAEVERRRLGVVARGRSQQEPLHDSDQRGDPA